MSLKELKQALVGGKEVTVGELNEEMLEDLVNQKLEEYAIDPTDENAAKVRKMIEARDIYMKSKEEKKKSLDINVLLPVVANVANVLMILHHEKLDVITTKAFGLLSKPKN